MSVTTITSVHCDGCGDHYYPNFGESTAQLRKALRKSGWRVNVPDAGTRLDYCARCK